MADYCPDCFEKLDALHICADTDSVKYERYAGNATWSRNQSLINFIIFAPIAGVALDFVLPLPSSLIHSFALSILGSALAAIVWVVFNFEGQKTFNFYLYNMKNFLFTPNLLKIFGATGNKRVLSKWLLVIASSTALQVVLFTPGNSLNLANQVSAKIHDASGANLKVECPKTKLFFYNERIECRVKTGILGITVPARSNISPILGNYQIKVSIL